MKSENQKPRPQLLLGDPHRLFTDVLAPVLRPDFEVTGVARTGAQLLAMARKLRPDMIITELSLPKKNGIEVLMALKKARNKARTIVLTASEGPDSIEQALAAGAHGYVLKTTSAADLLKAIDMVFKGRRVYPGVPIELSDKINGQSPDDKGEASSVGVDVLADLTKRQREVFHLVAQGHALKPIADILGVSRRTAELHKYAMMKKLGIRSTAQIIHFAVRNGFISL